MKLILLSGGSGRRLWPISNASRSKQFVKVLKRDDGTLESMVQRVWRQLEEAELTNSSYITTNQEQIGILQNQLGNQIPTLIEPQQMDTFPAITLACLYLHAQEKVHPDEVICVLPVDLYMEPEFINKMKEMDTILTTSHADLAMIGVTPKFPSDHYGYIIPKQDTSETAVNQKYIHVSHFVEKPDKETAENLVQKQALWNCGVFAFRLGNFLSMLKQKNYSLDYHHLYEQYGQLPKRSFDYEVVEELTNSVVIPYHGSWKDLGDWSTLIEELPSNIIGNGIISNDSTNTFVINELNTPVVIQNLSNILAAVSPDGIMVTNLSDRKNTKELLQKVRQRPMYEEKQWGWYRVYEHFPLQDERTILTKRLKIFKNRNISYQKHQNRNEIWVIISGEGRFALNQKMSKVKAGDVLQIPTGAWHGIRADSDLELIEIQMGTELSETDIVRMFSDWEDVEEICN
ncbi:sugar phosphate nucleotidyltransferase [Niallia sp. Krafla_26]|uniref:sugar phosphate nucleotidyltransferase n=1 Tax=Niallia sp. Krafla_26 TaxID=3064703 RepID=UPI003D184DDB